MTGTVIVGAGAILFAVMLLLRMQAQGSRTRRRAGDADSNGGYWSDGHGGHCDAGGHGDGGDCGGGDGD